MAKITFKFDDYIHKLNELRYEMDDIARKAVHEGAGIVADEVRKNLENVLSDEATGELLDSFGITPITMDKRGNLNAKVGFEGYDSKGVPNKLKARKLESGSSTQKKRPFIRTAVNATKEKVNRKMMDVVNEEIKKIMG